MDTLLVIKEVAGKQFGGEPESVDADVPVEQLGIDSLGFLEFLFELEDRFSLSIPQEDVKGVRTLRELAAVIDSLSAAAKPTTAS
jgi:acyl carrier protein